jgi:polyisoprenyl-teichoic acid--peptidoglycan teichoic acid transferase
MATIATTDRARKRPWLAAILSAIVPGAGQWYAGRVLRAVIWFGPIVVAAAAMIPLSRMTTADLVGTALDPPVLWTIFAANAFAAVWRIGCAIDAFVITDRTGEHRSENTGAAIGLAVGWAFLGLAVVAPHIAVGRYTYDAVTLVESVFVADTPGTTLEPIIPIGTDADIVPDPVVHTYEVDEVDPDSNRNLIFRLGVGDPDAIAAWDDILAERRTSAGSVPLPSFNERVGGTRITILFAGGDAGPGRGGLRTDSMMVATIDTVTGKAALFGFPRNMAQVPLPKKFADAFIDLEMKMTPPPPVEEPADPGTTGDGDGTEGGTVVEPAPFESCHCFPEQMNAIYPFTRRWTGTYPNEVDPGMAALRDVISNMMGLQIDYYALIDMAAFVDLVDAIGGIDVYVLKALESEVSPPREGEPWAYVNVQPGWNHLDGPQALAYARARKGSSDYTRMERQRCMVKAVAAKADAFTLLRSFPAIVDAIQDSVVTDIPLTFVPDLIEATAGLEFDDIDTIGITHAYWMPDRDYNGKPVPDVDKIRAKVKRVVSGQSSSESDLEVSGECEV